MAQQTMTDDLAKRVNEAISKTLKPLDDEEAKIDGALSELKVRERELLAQKERIDRMRDAAKLRKRPGRTPGAARRQAEPAAA